MLYFELDKKDGLPNGKHLGNDSSLSASVQYLVLPDNTDIELLYMLTSHYRAMHSPENYDVFCLQCSKLGYTPKGKIMR